MSTSTSPVDIRADHLEIVQDILRTQLPAGVKVWVFGSRANWTTKDSSDLDLAVEGAASLDHGVMVGLEIAFEESDLPYTVDVVDLNTVSLTFRQIVEGQKVPLPSGGASDKVDGVWNELPFSEAVLVNPAVRFDRGAIYPFVDMAAVNADSRSVYAGEERPFKGSGSKFQSGDTLMARITPCLENGKIARYQAQGSRQKGHGSTEFIVIRGRPIITDNDFAYYLTQWEEVRKYAIGQMTGTSGRQRVPVDSLDHLTVPLPPLPEQRAIAHILGTLDDKIELNRRMNRTLEEMARAIFQDWFVDFGPVRAKLEGREPYLPPDLWSIFPDRLVDSELGEIPEGWRVRSVEDVASVVGGSTPSTKVPEYWNGGINCWATPKDLSGLSVPVLLDTERKITESGLGRISSGLLPTGTVLLSSRAPIGYFAINEIPTAVNQGFIAMSPKPPVSNLFLLNWCATAVDDIVSHANGSTFLEVSKSNFRQISLVVPPYPLMESYHHTATNIHRKMVDNEYSSRTLNAQRNALLPKLVSGEVRICKCRQPARKG